MSLKKCITGVKGIVQCRGKMLSAHKMQAMDAKNFLDPALKCTGFYGKGLFRGWPLHIGTKKFHLRLETAVFKNAARRLKMETDVRLYYFRQENRSN
jgi:hypothetical protein